LDLGPNASAENIVQVPTRSFADRATALFEQSASPNAVIAKRLKVLRRFICSSLVEAAGAKSYMPSATIIKERDFVFFVRMSSTSLWAAEAEALQALALSALSKPMITNRLGGVPSNPMMFSVRVMNCPPNAATDGGALGKSCLNPSGFVISLISTITYLPEFYSAREAR
jgi:hypothetical protein